MLLPLGIIRNEGCQGGVDPSFLQESLESLLDTDVEVVKLQNRIRSVKAG